MDDLFPPTDATTTVKRERDDDHGNSDQKPLIKKVKLPTKECAICCEDVPINQFLILPRKAERHPRTACKKCWRKHIETEVKDKPWDTVTCLQCLGVLTQGEIKDLADKATYKAWLDKAAKDCREKDEEFCACPRAGCDWACFFCTKEDGNIFVCRKCGHRHCVVCEEAMHEGQTCAEYQEANRVRRERQARENEESEKEVAKVSKPCPQCGRRLDKYTGCDHVTCSMCRHEFCWECFAPYGGDQGIWRRSNSAHRDTCSRHSNRLPGYQPPVEVFMPLGNRANLPGA